MACKVIIDTERCKGCGLCVPACPKSCITISKQSNKNGYFPAQASCDDCTGCVLCAIVCPETVIDVYRDSSSNIVAIKPDKKNSTSVIRKKA